MSEIDRMVRLSQTTYRLEMLWERCEQERQRGSLDDATEDLLDKAVVEKRPSSLLFQTGQSFSVCLGCFKRSGSQLDAEGWIWLLRLYGRPRHETDLGQSKSSE